MKKITWFFLIVLFAVACSGKQEIEPKPQPQPQPQPTPQKEEHLKLVSTSSLAVGYKGSTVEIVFSAPAAWTASLANSSDNWITLQLTQGDKTSGNVKVPVTIAANDTYDDRSGKVIIRSGSEQVEVTITQRLKSAIILSETEISIDANGGEVSVTVSSSVQVTVVLPKDAPWISRVESKALTKTTYYFQIQPNQITSAREADISFVNQAESLNELVHITQDAFNPGEVAKAPGVYGVAGINYLYEKGKHQWMVRKENGMHKFVIIDPQAGKFLSVRMMLPVTEGDTVEASIIQTVTTDIPSLQEHISLTVLESGDDYILMASEDDATKLIKVAL